MSARVLSFAFAGAAFLLLAPGQLAAQATVVSRACSNPAITCFAVSGSVVFEAGATPPVDAVVRLRFPEGEGVEFLELRAVAPDYRFEARLPRLSSPEVTLISLPQPWLDDQAVEFGPLTAPRTIELRSAAGVSVTATFRYPQGTAAPPPFRASVRRSPNDRWFAPVQVSNGQFTFLARRDLSYAIAASPQEFGNVFAEFSGQAQAHAVVVDVDRRARPATQQAVLVEGPGASSGQRRAVMLPVVLDERSPSGGGPLPYSVTVLPGAGAADAVVGVSPAVAGRRQRLALLKLAITNDAIANGARSASVRFSPNPADAPASPELPITLLDDEASNLPPLLTVAGAALAADGLDAAMVLARPEGGPGEGWTITLELDRPAPEGGAAITVDTVSRTELEYPDPFRLRYPGALAVDGVDYQPVAQQRVTFAAGERTATVRIEGIGNDRIQRERRFFLAFTEAQVLAPRDPSIELRIVNDDVDGSPAARNDLLPVPPLPRSNVLDVLANDVLPAARYEGGRLEVLDAPQFGSLLLQTGSASTPLDDRLLYAPTSGSAGRMERLRYRICGPLQDACVSASVDIPIRPVPSESTAFTPSAEAGFRDFTFTGLTALSEARALLLARPIQAGDVSTGNVQPTQPRFGILWAPTLNLAPLSGGQTSATRTFVVHLRGEPGSDLDLHVAYDANNDALIDESERLCSSASRGTSETCLVRFAQTTSGASQLHLALANPGPTTSAYRLVAGAVDNTAAPNSLAATVQTRIPSGESFSARISWRNDASPLIHGALGLLRLGNLDEIGLGDVPLVIDLPRVDTALGLAPSLAPLGLRSGIAHAVQVSQGGGVRNDVFVDVPPGTGQLSLALSRPAGVLQPVEVSLRRAALPTAGTQPVPAAAPAADANSINRTMSGTTLDVVLGTPAPGRWYVVLEDRGAPTGAQSTLTATATLTGDSQAPVVRPGGYFNPARSGHGLFLYPSAGDWAGLWYTYTQDGAPVWYYLQGAAPGANGIWTAPIFRSGWNGSRNHLTEIGRATVTPTAADAFQFTYVLDGETGSEPFLNFGRGCPSVEGRVVNASGHWFDPARSGTGYSLQLFPNYEFYAVFVYSARGVPRFLIAERNGVGAANDTAPLQQLRGFCPLCVRSGDPERSTVGVLRREFVNGVLSRINVDATFTNGTPGTWTVNDTVTPLGGLQGCATP